MSLAVVVVALCLGVAPDPRLRAGVLLHDAGKYPEAIKLYRSVLADRPNDPAAVYELGYTLVSHGDYDAALELIDTAQHSDIAQSPRLFILQATAFDGRGQLPRGEAALRKGLELDPLNPELSYNLGVNLGQQERWPEATDAFKGSVERGPESPAGWLGLARAYEAQKLSQRAGLAYARSATLQREPGRAHDTAGRAVTLLGASDAASLERTLSQSDDAFFIEARTSGHSEALANELERLSGNAEANLWCAQNSKRWTAYREWLVDYTRRVALKR
jgi:predicted Zn-dependent protease